MDDEATRRIDEAAAAGARRKETQEFLQGLTKNDTLVRPIYNPEAWHMRDKAKAAATRGEIAKTECSHPLGLIHQYVDDDPSVKRNSKPVNLFACGVCGMLLWFSDPWGVAVGDA